MTPSVAESPEKREGEWVVGVDDDEEERWLKHYSSNHQILLVGDGDFSFSLSLAFAFYSASNIVATSLDSRDTVVTKYANAKANLEDLETMGATILHGLDATKMKLHSDLRMRKFDRIIYNFPHAGFKGKEDQIQLIKLHRQLVHGFFRNARYMLRPSGEVHVTHKTGSPYNKWKIEELASDNSLMLIECAAFNINDYLGYNNKRGDGVNCDQPFRLGECCTFKFTIGGEMHKKAAQMSHSKKKAAQKMKAPIGGEMHKKAAQMSHSKKKKAAQKMKAAMSRINPVNVTVEDGLWNATNIRYSQADFMPNMAGRTRRTFPEGIPTIMCSPPIVAEHIQTTLETSVGGTQRILYSPPWYGINNTSLWALGNHQLEPRRDTIRFGPDFRQAQGFMANGYESRIMGELPVAVRGHSDDIMGINAKYGSDTRHYADQGVARNGREPYMSYERCRSVHEYIRLPSDEAYYFGAVRGWLGRRECY